MPVDRHLSARLNPPPIPSHSTTANRYGGMRGRMQETEVDFFTLNLMGRVRAVVDIVCLRRCRCRCLIYGLMCHCTPFPTFVSSPPSQQRARRRSSQHAIHPSSHTTGHCGAHDRPAAAGPHCDVHRPVPAGVHPEVVCAQGHQRCRDGERVRGDWRSLWCCPVCCFVCVCV